MYRNNTTEILGEQAGNFQVEMKICIPSDLPNPDIFNNWVNQSVNLSCKQLCDKVLYKKLVSDRVGTSLLSQYPLVFDLLNQFFKPKNKIQTNTANTILNLELPLLDKIDIATLMSIRLKHGEEFQNFRVHLDKQFRELRSVKDPEELKIKAENTFHELSEVQIQAIKQKMIQMRKSAGLLDGIVLMGSLSAAISTGSLTTLGLSAAAVTMARGLKSFVDYDNQIKQNPAFFLWKV